MSEVLQEFSCVKLWKNFSEKHNVSILRVKYTKKIQALCLCLPWNDNMSYEQEDMNLHQNCHEYLKSHTFFQFFQNLINQET